MARNLFASARKDQGNETRDLISTIAPGPDVPHLETEQAHRKTSAGENDGP
jgi:hypothetical protein